MKGARLLAVPNISEGRDLTLVEHVAGTDALLDIHADPDHNRSVLTFGGSPDAVVRAVEGMLERASTMLGPLADGVHPRFGLIDVLPLVPYPLDEARTIAFAHRLAAIASELGMRIEFYERADPKGRHLPTVRRQLHDATSVICVGVRSPLVAFNVNFRGDLEHAKQTAKAVRGPGIRALGFPLASRELVQVSMNLTEPESIGVRAAYERVVEQAAGLDTVDAEIVGLAPDTALTDLEGIPLREPAHSIEAALGG